MRYGVILAAGSGKRFGKEKQLENLKGIPLYRYSVEHFLKSGMFEKVFLVVSEEKKDRFFIESQKVQIVFGGRERSDSVKNVLNKIRKSYSVEAGDFIFIHDAARPLIHKEYLKALDDTLKTFPAATLGYKVTDALKTGNEAGRIEGEVNREKIWAVTTPQGFHLKTLIELYMKAGEPVYDETALFSRAGYAVKIVESGRMNLKITYPEDWEIAEKLMETIF
jgi:2-C-methyl-D-erythritol 4-phosphate cytidylyltransferase